MMTVEEKVKSYFMDIANLGENEVDMNANLFSRYGIDSLKAIRLISDIEVEYDIDILDEVAQKICSLNDVVSIIKNQTDLE